jgi:hypothetical protein
MRALVEIEDTTGTRNVGEALMFERILRSNRTENMLQEQYQWRKAIPASTPCPEKFLT